MRHGVRAPPSLEKSQVTIGFLRNTGTRPAREAIDFDPLVHVRRWYLVRTPTPDGISWIRARLP